MTHGDQADPGEVSGRIRTHTRVASAGPSRGGGAGCGSVALALEAWFSPGPTRTNVAKMAGLGPLCCSRGLGCV